jgi:hypothetical protein
LLSKRQWRKCFGIGSSPFHLFISNEMEMERNKLAVFRGAILPFYSFFGQKCPLKTTKWILSISFEMERIFLLMFWLLQIGNYLN